VTVEESARRQCRNSEPHYSHNICSSAFLQCIAIRELIYSSDSHVMNGTLLHLKEQYVNCLVFCVLVKNFLLDNNIQKAVTFPTCNLTSVSQAIAACSTRTAQ